MRSKLGAGRDTSWSEGIRKKTATRVEAYESKEF